MSDGNLGVDLGATAATMRSAHPADSGGRHRQENGLKLDGPRCAQPASVEFEILVDQCLRTYIG